VDDTIVCPVCLSGIFPLAISLFTDYCLFVLLFMWAARRSKARSGNSKLKKQKLEEETKRTEIVGGGGERKW
jgi:hypothetical protein